MRVVYFVRMENIMLYRVTRLVNLGEYFKINRETFGWILLFFGQFFVKNFSNKRERRLHLLSFTISFFDLWLSLEFYLNWRLFGAIIEKLSEEWIEFYATWISSNVAVSKVLSLVVLTSETRLTLKCILVRSSLERSYIPRTYTWRIYLEGIFWATPFQGYTVV